MCEDHFACNVDEKSTSFDIGGQKMVAVGTEGATNNVLAVLNGKCDGCVAIIIIIVKLGLRGY